MLKKVEIGSVVRSISGKDTGHLYLVYDIIENGRFLLLVNGRDRKLLNPKKKNICHIQRTHNVSTRLNEMIQAGLNSTDELIREDLSIFGSDLG